MNEISLAQALRYVGVSAVFKQPARLAFAGAGGKTTALFTLARALIEGGTKSVFVTTSTHIGVEQVMLADRHLRIDELAELPASAPKGVTLFTGRDVAEDRLAGLDEETLSLLNLRAGSENVPLLVEADGSRMRPLKAPAEHEPAIPGFVDTVVVVAGLTGLGKPLSGEWVHRSERFAELAGLRDGDVITSQALARVLTHPLGGLKGIPVEARRFLLLNQVESIELQAAGKEIAEQCLEAYQSVIVAALNPKANFARSLSPAEGGEAVLTPNLYPLIASVYEPNAIILLAAGTSSRFGSPKQLIDWKGKPLVRHVAELALASGGGLVRVVVGAYSEQVSGALEGLPVEIVENPEWQEGQAASVRAGIRGLPKETGAALFLLVDQPQVPVELLQGLFGLHTQTLAPLTAPLCQGRRANPVLFDRVTFPDLLALKGDMGGRALFERPEKYPAAWLSWEDERLLWDVDTEEEYKKLI
jgi:molybdenum cofactor cytidylyltransferase